MSRLCFSRLRIQSDKLTRESNPTPTKLVKLESEVQQNSTNFLFHSRLIINLLSLLQQFCCRLNCFDLAYLLILAQSAVPRLSFLEKALAVLIDLVRCCYLYTLQLYCKLSTDYWYLVFCSGSSIKDVYTKS